MSREVMKQALEALESDPTSLAWLISKKQAITALRQALETEQEPVAWMHTTGTGHVYFRKKPQDKVFNPQPVYTSSKREWVGLTDEEIAQGLKESWVTEQAWQSAVWWAEAKLKEKNT